MTANRHWLAALSILTFASVSCDAGEGFGSARKIVTIDRLSPPEVALPGKRYKMVFADSTQKAEALRQRIVSLIEAGDPEMKMADDAPFVLEVTVREFLHGNTHGIDGTYRLSSLSDKTLRDGSVGASNAGTLRPDSDTELIENAARDVAGIIAPLRWSTGTVVPKGHLQEAAALAERGDWRAYLTAVERLPAQRGEAEAYREYALAIGHEGVAYQSRDLASLVKHLRQAIAHNQAAARLKPSEKFFSEQSMRLFKSPGTPPKLWVAPRSMEKWESRLRVQSWLAQPPAENGTLDMRGVLELIHAGRSDEQVLSEIRNATRVQFALAREDVTALSNAGLSWAVIGAMRSKAGLPPAEFSITPDAW